MTLSPIPKKKKKILIGKGKKRDCWKWLSRIPFPQIGMPETLTERTSERGIFR
jgi:hypothetical protein